jgi:hypothetical protein
MKSTMLIAVAASALFAGVEPSPFTPIWKIIIIILGG